MRGRLEGVRVAIAAAKRRCRAAVRTRQGGAAAKERQIAAGHRG